MNNQRIFPARALSASTSEPSIDLEGQKVIFDKKVSLLPVDIKKVEEKNGNSGKRVDG